MINISPWYPLILNIVGLHGFTLLTLDTGWNDWDDWEQPPATSVQIHGWATRGHSPHLRFGHQKWLFKFEFSGPIWSNMAQYGPICPNMVQYQLFRINQISTTKKNTTNIQFIQLLNMFACLEVVNAPKNLVQFWAQGPQQVPCPEHGEGPDMTRPRLSSFDLWPSKGLLAIIPSIMSIMSIISIFPSPLPQMILSPAPLF